MFLFPTKTLAYNPLSVPNNIYGMGIINHSDIGDVKNLVNFNGGDWGYVKVVITEKERNKEVWQKFLDDCRRDNLIPIIRIASNFDGSNWEIPKLDEIDNWVSFFDSLNWVTENRYLIIGNEPNHAKEWGGKISPEEYAVYLKEFSVKLKNSSNDYFVLNAGFDQDAPNGKNTMDQRIFLERMVKANPDIFNYVDGWNSHSYPNPAFSGSEKATGRRTIRGYEWELEYLQFLRVTKDLPIFITETGWVRNDKNVTLIAEKLKYAFEQVWSKDEKVVAVIPFILNYQQEPFYQFSWKNKDGSYYPIYETMQMIQKKKGNPIQRIEGNVILSFLNPLMFAGRDQKGLFVARNTGQAIWKQSDAHVINEPLDGFGSLLDIKISNTKFSPIEPFSTGLVVYTLHIQNKGFGQEARLGFFVKGKKIDDVYSGKIIGF